MCLFCALKFMPELNLMVLQIFKYKMYTQQEHFNCFWWYVPCRPTRVQFQNEFVFFFSVSLIVITLIYYNLFFYFYDFMKFNDSLGLYLLKKIKKKSTTKL